MTGPTTAATEPASAHTSPTESRSPDMTPEDATQAVLVSLTAATWPDGSPLIDVDAAVLDHRLRPHILTALTAVAPARGETP